MITYIKQLSLDTTLMALGNQLRAETEHYKVNPTVQQLRVIKALFKDYRCLYRRFMKLDYPYKLLNGRSALHYPFELFEEIEFALEEHNKDKELKDLREFLKGLGGDFYL